MTSPPVHARIAAGRRHSIGVSADGSVVTAGRPGAVELRTTGWNEVVAVAAGDRARRTEHRSFPLGRSSQ